MSQLRVTHWERPSGEIPDSTTGYPPEMVITRREVLAITSVLRRSPQTMLSDPYATSINNFTFNVIEDPSVSPSKGHTREILARTDDRDLEEPMTL